MYTKEYTRSMIIISRNIDSGSVLSEVSLVFEAVRLDLEILF